MYLTLWSGIGLVSTTNSNGGDISGVVTLTVTSVSYIVVGYWLVSRLTMVVILVVTLTVTSVSYIVVGYWFGE